MFFEVCAVQRPERKKLIYSNGDRKNFEGQNLFALFAFR